MPGRLSSVGNRNRDDLAPLELRDGECHEGCRGLGVDADVRNPGFGEDRVRLSRRYRLQHPPIFIEYSLGSIEG